MEDIYIYIYIYIHKKHTANDQEVEKAKELVKKLQFQFSCENFENPHLQYFYSCLEAMALERENPEEVSDFTRESSLFPINLINNTNNNNIIIINNNSSNSNNNINNIKVKTNNKPSYRLQ